MTNRHLFLALTALLLGVISTQALAIQEVCVINNSSKAIKIVATGEGAGEIEYGPHGGDKNRCFRISASAHGTHFQQYVKNSSGQYQVESMRPYFFQNPPLTASGFFWWDSLSAWAPNDKDCGNSICLHHTGLTDVYRMYVEDKQ